MNRTAHMGSRNASRTGRQLRTPGISECRMQEFSFGPKHPLLPDEVEEQLESLEVLLKQTWTIWAVSSLFNFEPNSELKLRQYAKKLREEVAEILPHEDVTYDAEFTVLEDIRFKPDANAPPALKVQVFSRANDNREVEKSIYNGIFMSWRTEATEFSCDNTTRLPLLLCRGTKSAMKAVHTTISHIFDCIVIALPAREDELMWLVPALLTPDSNKEKPETGDVRFEYRVPQLPPSSSVTVLFDVPDLVKMWTTVYENDDDSELKIKSEHVSKFHAVMKQQMLEVGGLQLNLCVLNKIVLPSFTMTDNRMKANTTESMNRFLLFFNLRALNILHTLDYDTTQTTSFETIPSN